jgi:hypothetical protein
MSDDLALLYPDRDKWAKDTFDTLKGSAGGDCEH